MGESYEKLVRDNIPEILDAKGVLHEDRIATPEEFKTELIKKLAEEMKELNHAVEHEPEKAVEELADVIEVDQALEIFPEFIDSKEGQQIRELIESFKQQPMFANVEEVRLKKREERGGFDKMIIVKGEK